MTGDPHDVCARCGNERWQHRRELAINETIFEWCPALFLEKERTPPRSRSHTGRCRMNVKCRHALSVIERIRVRFDNAPDKSGHHRPVLMDRADVEALEALAIECGYEEAAKRALAEKAARVNHEDEMSALHKHLLDNGQ